MANSSYAVDDGFETQLFAYLGITVTTDPSSIHNQASAVPRTYSTTPNGLDGASQRTQLALITVMNIQKHTTLAMLDETNGQCYKTGKKQIQ